MLNPILFITREIFVQVKQVLCSKKTHQLLGLFRWIPLLDFARFQAFASNLEAVDLLNPSVEANHHPGIDGLDWLKIVMEELKLEHPSSITFVWGQENT